MPGHLLKYLDKLNQTLNVDLEIYVIFKAPSVMLVGSSLVRTRTVAHPVLTHTALFSYLTNGHASYVRS